MTTKTKTKDVDIKPVGLKKKGSIDRRDYFAGIALQALIGSTHPAQSSLDALAKKAFSYADSMIEAAAVEPGE